MKIQQVNDVVVVPWDYSDLSRAALVKAYEMVERPALIRVVHVSPVVSPYELGVAWEVIPEETLRTQLVESFRKEMQSDTRFQEISFTVLFGDPGRQICDFAAEHHAELIVVPSHGRSGFTRLLLGSVAERIVRLAPCPVLVLRTAPPVEVPAAKHTSVTVFA